MEEVQDTLGHANLSKDLNIDHPLGRDEFLYDLIGINLIGLKSVIVLIKDPKTYFNAALTPDWEGRFWPSMRMWLGLMTIMIGLQFIWASDSSEMTAMFRMMASSAVEGFQRGAELDGKELDLSWFDPVQSGKDMFRQYIFIYPFIFVAFMCLLAFIFRGWERKLPYIARVRFIFAIIVPGTVFGLITTLLLSAVNGMMYQIISLAVMVLMLGIYWVTAYRGAYAHAPKGTALGMSFIAAFLILLTLTLAQFVAMMIAVIPGVMDVVETLRPQLDVIKAAKEPTSG